MSFRTGYLLRQEPRNGLQPLSIYSFLFPKEVGLPGGRPHTLQLQGQCAFRIKAFSINFL